MSRKIIEESAKLFPAYRSPSTGSDGYTRFNPFVRDLVATSGTMEMTQDIEASWFLDIVASYMSQIKKRFRANEEESFFVCRLNKLPGDPSKALFTIDDGMEGEPFIVQEIPYTDAPTNIKSYLQAGSLDGETITWVLMMPEEY